VDARDLPALCAFRPGELSENGRMTNLPLGIELLLGRDISGEQELEIKKAFTQFGTVSSVRRAVAYRGPNELEWLVLAALPLQAFLQNLGSLMGADAYGGFKRLVQRLSRRGDSGTPRAPLILQDIQSGVRIVLDWDLPAEAYQKLVELDLKHYRYGPVHYDQTRGCWRSEIDEAAD
jgi:hypothetical protein